MNSKVYDVLKPIAMIWLPAFASFYFAVASIWGFHDTTAVIGTLSAADAFLGVILGISSKIYTPPVDGAIVVDNNGLKTVQLPGLEAHQIAAKPTLTLQVKNETTGAPS